MVTGTEPATYKNSLDHGMHQWMIWLIQNESLAHTPWLLKVSLESNKDMLKFDSKWEFRQHQTGVPLMVKKKNFDIYRSEALSFKNKQTKGTSPLKKIKNRQIIL